MIDSRSIQLYLQEKDLYRGPIDGIIGPQSGKAIGQALREDGINPTYWTPARELVGVQQLIMIEGGVPRAEVGKIDGYMGPMFANAFEHWQDLQRIAPIYAPIVNTSKRWPQQKDVESFFGRPGQNLVSVTMPYEMYASWSQERVRTTRVNKLVAESFEKVLMNVRDTYSAHERSSLGLDQYSGGFNIRPMKSSSKLSMHAYGIAFDFDDQHNQFRWTRAQARFAQPEYDCWWKCWEEEGWISLGRERDFDWMHTQAARLSA